MVEVGRLCAISYIDREIENIYCSALSRQTRSFAWEWKSGSCQNVTRRLEREREREGERERHRQTDRQTDRYTHTHIQVGYTLLLKRQVDFLQPICNEELWK